MRHDDRALACALERRENVQEKCVVAIFRRWNTESKAAIRVMFCVDAIAPRLAGEWWIRDHEIKRLQTALIGEVGTRKGVAFPYFRRRAVVQEHVHFCERPGRKIILLSVDRKIFSARAFGFVVSLEEQRPGPARGIVNCLRAALCGTNSNYLCHDARNFRRGVELPLALAGLRCEMAHQIFISVTEKVIA